MGKSLLSLAIFNNLYGMTIAAGIVVCILIASYMSKKRGYHEDLVLIVAAICIPLAVIGARLYYVAFSGNDWTFKKILGFTQNGYDGLRGLALYGGIIGAAIGSPIVWYIFQRKKPEDRVTFLQMFDLFFVLIILGQAIGRWGNFFNQEAFGNPIDNPSLQWFPIAVWIDELSGYYQATFFYESFPNMIGFIVLFWLYMGKRKSFDGFTFSIYCIWYGLVRFIVEGLRSDSLMLGNLAIFRSIHSDFLDSIRVSQLISLLMILLGLSIIAVHIIRAIRSNKKIFIFVDQQRLSNDYLDYDKSRLSKPMRQYNVKKQPPQAAVTEADCAASACTNEPSPAQDAGTDLDIQPQNNEDSKAKKDTQNA